ncbi:MAG: hypothetical protein GY715_13325 [Planctomycetes bacterium]|nr:hypothetical protein [Planctomycetota bacterium]
MTTAPAPPTTPGRIVNPVLPMSRLAVWALILGVIGTVLPLVGLLGLILGIMTLRGLLRSQARRQGKGVAIAAICTGAAGLLVTTFGYGFMVAITYPALAQTRVQIKAATTHAFMRSSVVPLHQRVRDEALDKGAYPWHVAELILLDGADTFDVRGYVTSMLVNGQPVGVRVGSYDLAPFDSSPEARAALRAALDQLDPTLPFYEFGELWFARLKETHDNPNLVFCWAADPENHSLFVVSDNGTLQRFTLDSWDDVWQRDAWAREELGIEPATPRCP